MDHILTTFINIYITVLIYSLIDFIPRIRRKFTKKIYILDKSLKNEDYTIVLPVFGKPQFLDGLDKLSKYGNKVLLTTTKFETIEFNTKVQQLVEKYDFNVVKVTLPKDKYGNDIKTTPALLQRALPHVKTKYVIRLDADSYPLENLNMLFGNMEFNDYDLASAKVLPNPEQKQNIMWHLQDAEYTTAMDNRNLYPFVTSGAAIIGKTSKLKKISQNHSLFPNGEDSEHGRLATIMDMKVGYIPFTIYTDVPLTIKEWFNQRGNWLIGAFRHKIINIKFTSQYPWFLFYYVLIVYLMLPFRAYHSVMHPEMLPIIFLVYASVTFFFRMSTYKWFYIFFPIYAFVQSTILPFIGIYRYFRKAIRMGNWGLMTTNRVIKI